MLEIDGAYGEGGGQLVRTACALSAITGRAFRLANIRARRAPPGLAPQHLAAVRAVAALCGADVEAVTAPSLAHGPRTRVPCVPPNTSPIGEGLALRATEFVFRPGPIRAGEFRFDVGTAGAITLVLQACLPVALAAPSPVRMVITGGSDVRAAPPLDYFRFVLMPLLARLNLTVQLLVHRRGYYPRGGGEIEVRVMPSRPRAFECVEAGALRAIHGVAHCANLPAHIASRMAAAARRTLGEGFHAEIEEQVLTREQAIGPGGAIVLWAERGDTRLGAAAVAERGVPAEHLGETAARELLTELEAGAILDRHALDQLLIYLACARGRSTFLAREWSAHASTVAWLIGQFLPARITTTASNGLVRVEVEPHA
jgi:RNA 3'-phosphate cyclase